MMIGKGSAGPTLDHERQLWQAGYHRVAGIDEAGRGALAGPVVAAAVILPEGVAFEGIWAQVQDSKRLTSVRRMALATEVMAQAAAWAVGVVTASEIDRLGIAPATRLAMQIAVEGMAPGPDFLLLDWVRLSQVNLPQLSLSKADAQIVSVAAASILAKVHRDQILVESGAQYPGYGFQANKGYASSAHLLALSRIGPCPIHRVSFAPLARPPSLFD